jgi:dTDP-L-rhamnose 4-epimerase
VNLVTGGAGFIGSHLVDALVRAGEKVRVLDDLSSGREENLAASHANVELVRGSVADAATVRRAMAGVRRVFHLAARPSVQKSFEEPELAHEVNAGGTMRVAVEAARAGVERLIFAGSCAVYGDAGAGPAVEEQRLDPKSPYAAQKLLGEHYCRLLGAGRGLRAVVLRFFNVYGPRQALSNPYTGALAIFAARLLNDRRPVIYEDGGQRRDFVNVADVARACRLALERDGADGRPVNIGSGRSATVLEIADRLGRVLGKEIEPELPGTFRAGDIRHCFADVTLARVELGFEAEVALEDGMASLAGWLEGQVATDRFDDAAAELAERGLTR